MDFGSLNAPSKLFFKFSKYCLEIFSNFFNKTPQILNIKKLIKAKCIDVIRSLPEFDEVLNPNNKCYDHHTILDFMILVLLMKHCKLVTVKNISHSKMSILKS